jgi:hypothetical protein
MSEPKKPGIRRRWPTVEAARRIDRELRADEKPAWTPGHQHFAEVLADEAIDRVLAKAAAGKKRTTRRKKP